MRAENGGTYIGKAVECIYAEVCVRRVRWIPRLGWISG